jgi:hypothetical protein
VAKVLSEPATFGDDPAQDQAAIIAGADAVRLGLASQPRQAHLHGQLATALVRASFNPS